MLFVAQRRRDSLGWLNLLGLATVALFFLIWIPWNYQGGGGFVGNRYFVNVYPAFLFLVGPIRPRNLVPAGFALGGLLLGPVLFMPFGAPVAWTTLQAHVRNFPYPLFPLELSLRNLPGYESVKLGGIKVFGRRERSPTARRQHLARRRRRRRGLAEQRRAAACGGLPGA